MTAKHTPGPWEASRWRVCGRIDTDRICVICDTAHNAKSRTPENEANARLIAAAPDLLAACQQLLKDFNQLWLDTTDGEHGEPLDQGPNMARAAIAKATGETK
jgi:hypothetical protein